MKEVFDNGGVSLLHITNSNTIILRIYGFNPTYCDAIASAINSENLSEKYAGTKSDIIIKFADIVKNDISNKFDGTTSKTIIDHLYQKLHLINYVVSGSNSYKPHKYSFEFIHNNISHTLEILIDANTIEIIIMKF